MAKSFFIQAKVPWGKGKKFSAQAKPNDDDTDLPNFAPMAINAVEIQNFKSIREARVEFTNINVLIGPNGAGKSNFIGFFKLLNDIYEQRLQDFARKSGRVDNLLYFGRKKSPTLGGAVDFLNDKGWVSNRYEFKLTPVNGKSFSLDEWSCYNTSGEKPLWDKNHNWDLDESRIRESDSYRDKYLRQYFQELRIFHFHDTSDSAALKQPCRLGDNRRLRPDGSNLAAILFKLRETKPRAFKMIEKTVESVAPFFDGFDLAPDEISPDYIELVWREKGSDEYFNASNLSDGTLRFICLATLLLQNPPPPIIIIDEPELGLHPFAIAKLAALVKKAGQESQIILSTQSAALLDYFSPDDIVVVERADQQTAFRRLDAIEFESWLEEYSLGELWDKNVLGGRP